MNNKLFYSGLSVFILEVIIVLGIILSKLDWSWLIQSLIPITLISLIALVNIFALILVIVGAITKKEVE